MKEDERILMLWCLYQNTKDSLIRTFIYPFEMANKRRWYLLEKWERKGFVESGTSVNHIWITDEGLNYFEKTIDINNMM